MRPAQAGEQVTLSGWVDVRRDHGKIVFIDLRDESGVAQLVLTPPLAATEAAPVRSEWVIKVTGTVAARPAAQVNPQIPSGEIEVAVTALEVINEATTPPFALNTDGHDVKEEVRLKHRYLDLRRPRLQHNLRLRSQFVEAARQYLFSQGFTEIETPYFTSTTPEGSRDFVVPSRLYPGKFFALPQSPQQYKQLLMVAGFEKYFQIARCFRDEDLRADRGFEHTQIDIELSFVTREDIMALDEAMITAAVEAVGLSLKEKPFPRYTYARALEQFGSDKFDLRTKEDKAANRLAFAWVTDFPFFEQAEDGGWTFTHNPFSAPLDEHLAWHREGSHTEEIVTQQYDLVCNSFEVGGGSVRAHQPETLRATFRTMGYSDAQIEQDFGHMLAALSAGAPPHGGIAHGVERLVMTLTGEQYLREVQAFPQTSTGRTSVMSAPTPLAPAQLTELHLKLDQPRA
ncbi:MAG: hypothetical protein A2854_05205 [Parcubacteria group bacterium RIFCSPHIGHO2_01_FULL_56_18]|nr:MAG: hypothetical protein A2854_05205 [Parcubacteria group bacterium RIFCSPHIGHO2_01_FULL_56_18]